MSPEVRQLLEDFLSLNVTVPVLGYWKDGRWTRGGFRELQERARALLDAAPAREPCGCDRWPTLHWRGPNCEVPE